MHFTKIRSIRNLFSQCMDYCKSLGIVHFAVNLAPGHQDDKCEEK